MKSEIRVFDVTAKEERENENCFVRRWKGRESV